MECIDINSIKIIFDKEKTQKNITFYNEPCDCHYCKNYYKNMESNKELQDFLMQFGIDYLRCEEVISYDLGDDKDSLIESIAYYDVFGKIEREFSIKKYGHTISFKISENINVEHEEDDEYFWIVIEASMPYVLDEERELPYVSSKRNIYYKIKQLFSKLFETKTDK